MARDDETKRNGLPYGIKRKKSHPAKGGRGEGDGRRLKMEMMGITPCPNCLASTTDLLAGMKSALQRTVEESR